MPGLQVFRRGAISATRDRRTADGQFDSRSALSLCQLRPSLLFQAVSPSERSLRPAPLALLVGLSCSTPLVLFFSWAKAISAHSSPEKKEKSPPFPAGS